MERELTIAGYHWDNEELKKEEKHKTNTNND